MSGVFEKLQAGDLGFEPSPETFRTYRRDFANALPKVVSDTNDPRRLVAR